MLPVSDFLASVSLSSDNIPLYQLSFTHKSYTNEKETGESNERLEFLGDAVLELLISEYLFKTYPDADEGEMTGLRSATVRKESLAQVAKDLAFGKYLRLSKGEQKGNGAQKDYLLANTFEAFLGALFLDKGLTSCSDFLQHYLFGMIEGFRVENGYIGPKTRFQEAVQGAQGITPHYILISDEGPDHSKLFTMAAMIGKTEVAKGTGNSKQKAESNAADLAYRTLFSSEV